MCCGDKIVVAHAFVVNCLFATIVFKYVAALWIFPAYLREYRGDYATVAAEIEALTRGLRSTRPMFRRRA